VTRDQIMRTQRSTHIEPPPGADLWTLLRHAPLVRQRQGGKHARSGLDCMRR
jgi:hypothetical protein